MNRIKILLVSCSFLICASALSQEFMNPVNPCSLTPEGWIKTILIAQRNGLTGTLDTLVFPFSHHGWAGDPFLKGTGASKVGNWVPYEQTAYYCDGVLRCGYLLDDEFLIRKAQAAIYGAIEDADRHGGIIGSVLSEGDRSRWPQAVFCRAMMEEYEATGNKRIISAMTRHFLNDKTVLAGRDLVNIEAMAWLYSKTGDKRILSKIESAYKIPYQPDMHAVSYHEMLKLPIIHYMLDGNKTYLEEARACLDKLDRENMLPDGVSSGEEGLSGRDASNMHETCNVTDYIWTLTYMLRATSEVVWADKIERALFNAGLGSVTKSFDAHQYFSCPNQVFCDDNSSQNQAYNLSRMAYRQFHRPPCCTGNVNRMVPIFVDNMWMEGKDASLFKTLYGPGRIRHIAKGKEIELEEQSCYPFSDTIRLRVTDGEAYFALYLRIPSWCKSPKATLNGKSIDRVVAGEFCKIERKFAKGDEVVLIFPKTAEFLQWDYHTMCVNYGPLLFALPVQAEISKSYYEADGKERGYYGYRMTPVSDWNYVLGVDGTDNTLIRVVNHQVTDADNPWMQQPCPIELCVPMYKDPTWRPIYNEVKVNGKVEYAPMTPPLPALGEMIFVLRRQSLEVKKLVPFGSTCLRMSMFPFHSETKISPEILAAE